MVPGGGNITVLLMVVSSPIFAKLNVQAPVPIQRKYSPEPAVQVMEYQILGGLVQSSCSFEVEETGAGGTAIYCGRRWAL